MSINPKRIFSNINRGRLVFICLFGFLFFGAIATFLGFNIFKAGFIQIYNLALVGIFFLIAMACLYPLLNPQKHIRSYNHPEEYGMERAMRHRQIIYNVFFFFVFLYLLFVNYNSIQYLLNPGKIDISQLYKFQAVLSQDVEFIDPVEGGSSLYLYIEGEKDLKFNIPYSNDNWYIEDEIFKGDSIVLTIQKEDYKKWISKKQKLDFDDKYLGYGIISLYGIQKGEISFWDPESFQLKNEESEEQNFLAIQILNILTILGFVFWYFRKKKKSKNKLISSSTKD